MYGGLLVFSTEFGWGTFCDDNADAANEAVISRELGYTCQLMNNWHGVHWGMDAYPITLGMGSDSLCNGNE
jgi:hypothetical protein